MKKFTVYGFTAGVSGTVLGILLGVRLAKCVDLDERIQYEVSVNFHPLIAVIALICGVVHYGLHAANFMSKLRPSLTESSRSWVEFP